MSHRNWNLRWLVLLATFAGLFQARAVQAQVEQPLRSILVEQEKGAATQAAKEPASKPQVASQAGASRTPDLFSTPKSVSLTRALGIRVLDSAAGPKIRAIAKNGVAAKIGLRSGDIITSLGGKEIYSLAQLENALSSVVRTGNREADLLGIRIGRPISLKLNASSVEASHAKLNRAVQQAVAAKQIAKQARVASANANAKPLTVQDPVPLMSIDPALAAPVKTILPPQELSVETVGTLELNAPVNANPTSAVTQADLLMPLTPESTSLVAPTSFSANPPAPPAPLRSAVPAQISLNNPPIPTLVPPVRPGLVRSAASPLVIGQTGAAAPVNAGRRAGQPVVPLPRNQGIQAQQAAVQAQNAQARAQQVARAPQAGGYRVYRVQQPNGQVIRVVQQQYPNGPQAMRPRAVPQPVQPLPLMRRALTPVRRLLGRE